MPLSQPSFQGSDEGERGKAQKTDRTFLPAPAHGRNCHQIDLPMSRSRTMIKKVGRPALLLNKADITALFHTSQPSAAQRLGVSVSWLKRECRKLGIRQWPYQRNNQKSGGGVSGGSADAHHGTRCLNPKYTQTCDLAVHVRKSTRDLLEVATVASADTDMPYRAMPLSRGIMCFNTVNPCDIPTFQGEDTSHDTETHGGTETLPQDTHFNSMKVGTRLATQATSTNHHQSLQTDFHVQVSTQHFIIGDFIDNFVEQASSDCLTQLATEATACLGEQALVYQS